MKFVRLSLIAAMSALAGGMSSAVAQNVQGVPDNAAANSAPGGVPAIQMPSEFLMEPDAQIEGFNIKQQTYRSKAVGQNKAWDLDIGRFQGRYDEDPNNLNNAVQELDEETYSGMRLRLPFRGRTE